MFPPGSEVGGRFRIEGVIGSGGMGAVYRALDLAEGENRVVALKTLSPPLARDEKIVRRFRTEMEILQSLRHPGIVPVFEGGRDHDVLYYAMKLVEGRTLAQAIREDGTLDAARFVRLFLQLVQAIGYLHGAGCIHRDIKPDNILITAGSEAVLTDFGIAAFRETYDVDAGQVVGSAPYMAPEQWEGTATPRSDLYSLGVVMYEAASGKPAFGGPRLRDYLRQHVEEVPPPLFDSRPDMPDELCELVDRCLRKRPEDRPGSAAELADRLIVIGSSCPPSERAGNTADSVSPGCQVGPDVEPVPPDIARADTIPSLPEHVLESYWGRVKGPVEPILSKFDDPPPGPLLRKLRESDKCLAEGHLAGAIRHLERAYRTRFGEVDEVVQQLKDLRRVIDKEKKYEIEASNLVKEKRYADAEELLRSFMRVYERTRLRSQWDRIKEYREETDRIFTNAKSAMDAGQYRKAKRLFGKVIAREPDREWAAAHLRDLGGRRKKAYRKWVGRFALAAFALVAVAVVAPEFRGIVSAPVTGLANVFHAGGYDIHPPVVNAHTFLRIANWLDPNAPEVMRTAAAIKAALTEKGKRALNDEDPAAALAYFRAALRIDPEDRYLQGQVGRLGEP